MKFLKILFITILFCSCSKDSSSQISYIKADTFINTPGYFILDKGNLSVKEFKDGSLTFAVSNRYNKLQYQHSLFKSFNNYQYWTFYIDKDQSIWFYSADIQTLLVLIYDNTNKSYQLESNSNLALPPTLLNELNKNGVSKIK